MSQHQLLSIVIPTYNRAHLIADTLDSLLAQSNPNFEVIIVDDGSTDNTASVVAPYLKHENFSYHPKENAERGAARNYGANLAKGTYVNFFDSDDLALANHVEEAFKTIEKYSQPEAFHLSFQWQDTEGNVFQKCSYEGKVNDKIIQHNILSCNGVFVRTAIAKAHPFSENRTLSGSEDWELWLRLAKKYDFVSNGTITSTIINHDGRSVIVQNIDRVISRFEVLLSMISDPSNIQLSPKEIRHIKMECYSYVALHAALDKSSKKKAVDYLKKSLHYSKTLLFQRRFLAIIKHLIFS